MFHSDSAHAISALGRFQSNFVIIYHEATKDVRGYLQHIKDLMMVFRILLNFVLLSIQVLILPVVVKSIYGYVFTLTGSSIT